MGKQLFSEGLTARNVNQKGNTGQTAYFYSFFQKKKFKKSILLPYFFKFLQFLPQKYLVLIQKNIFHKKFGEKRQKTTVKSQLKFHVPDTKILGCFFFFFLRGWGGECGRRPRSGLRPPRLSFSLEKEQSRTPTVRGKCFEGYWGKGDQKNRQL